MQLFMKLALRYQQYHKLHAPETPLRVGPGKSPSVSGRHFPSTHYAPQWYLKTNGTLDYILENYIVDAQ